MSFITYVMSGLKELLKGQGGCLEDMSVFEIGIASDLSESTDTNITVKWKILAFWFLCHTCQVAPCCQEDL